MAKSAKVEKVSYTHEAICLWLIENPHRPLRDCAAYFGYTQAWLSTVIHSDAFQEQLGKRQQEFAIMTCGDIRTKMEVAADVAISGLTRKLENTQDGKFLLDATDKLLSRMGYGAATMRNPQPTIVTNVLTINSSDLAEARNLLAQSLRREETGGMKEGMLIEHKD